MERSTYLHERFLNVEGTAVRVPPNRRSPGARLARARRPAGRIAVSKLGSLRSEGCTTLVFEKDLGDTAGAGTERLREGATAVRALMSREVFVLPSTTRMDRWAKAVAWRGTFFVFLSPDTVLLCDQRSLHRADPMARSFSGATTS
jgi:hypothetical protein